MLLKPAHVKKKVWDQHITWMNVMREGQLNGKETNTVPVNENKKPVPGGKAVLGENPPQQNEDDR